MKNRFTNQINNLKNELISEILILVGDKEIKLRHETVNCREDSFNRLTKNGARLIINDENWGELKYEHFSLEELDNIYKKLKN